MADTRKKYGKRKRITEGDSVKGLKKFVVERKGKGKGKGKGKNVGQKSSKSEDRLVIHSDIKHSEVQLDSDFDVHVVKSEGQVLSQNIIPTERILKLWDLYYEGCNRKFTGKVIYWCDVEVPNIIAKKLNESQLEKFKATCFGNFLEFGEHQMYSQIIHHALVREVHQMDDGEMWFLFGEKRVRFGLPEFCLISGLRWQGEDDITAYKRMENMLIEKFFGDEAVTRSSIGRVYRKAVFDDDDEAIKMSLIFLVFNFILSTVSENYVDGAMVNFLCYGDVSSFPWGKVAFEMTKCSLSNALKGRLKKGRNGGSIYNLYMDHYTKLYKLKGLPYVFQVFMFETIPTFKTRGICNDEHPSDVRLFRWKELVKPPTNDKLNDLVFCSEQLRIKSLIPTSEEKDRLDLGGLHFLNGKDADKKVEKKVKGDNIGFDISEVKDAIDARFRPLEKKVSEIKKDIVKLRADIKDDIHVLHVHLCRDFRSIIRDELRGIKDFGDKQVDGDSDDDSDDGGDDDEDGADETDDVFKGNYNDDDEVGDDGLKADEVGDDGLKADEKNDEFETEVVKESEDVMVDEVVKESEDVMVDEVVKDDEVVKEFEDPHVDEDVDDGSKLKNNDGDDVLNFVEKKDGNEIEIGNEVERDVMVEEHHEIKINDDAENVKIDKNNDMPSLTY